MSNDETTGNAAASAGRSAADPTVDFTTLLLSINEGALQAMGVRDGDQETDLDAAKYQIDMLGMLQSKTSGNLTDEEDRLLRTILYELRTTYVRATRG